MKSSRCPGFVKSFKIYKAVGPGLGWMFMLSTMNINADVCRCSSIECWLHKIEMRDETVGVFGLELPAWGCRCGSQGIGVEESLYLCVRAEKMNTIQRKTSHALILSTLPYWTLPFILHCNVFASHLYVRSWTRNALFFEILATQHTYMYIYNQTLSWNPHRLLECSIVELEQ